MGHPGPRPGPPSDLRFRSLTIREYSGILYRTYRKGRDHEPLFFGRTGRNRFDDPLGEFGVLYAALDQHGAFIETFGQSTGNRALSTAELAERHLSRLSTRRRLRLVLLRRWEITGRGIAEKTSSRQERSRGGFYRRNSG